MRQLPPIDQITWTDIQSYNGNSINIPDLLNQIALSEDLQHCESLLELRDKLIHQFSCSEASFYVFPYLVNIGLNLQPTNATHIWLLAGDIASGYSENISALQPLIMNFFSDHLAIAEKSCLQLISNFKYDSYMLFELSKSAFAFAKHPFGQLIMDNFDPIGQAETTAICPNCSCQVEVAVFSSGLVVEPTESNHYPKPPKLNNPPAHPITLPLQPRRPNPWILIGESIKSYTKHGDVNNIIKHLIAGSETAIAGVVPSTDGESAFCLLGSLFVINGYYESGLRYFHACDSVTCLNCGMEFRFANHWWGLKRE